MGVKAMLERSRTIRLLAAAFQKKAVRILLPVLIFGAVIWMGSRELKQVSPGEMLSELHRLPPLGLVGILLLAMFAVGIMSAYDFVIRRQFGFQVGAGKTFRFAWIANTFNNLLGFAGLTGAGVRTLLYRKGGVPLASITAGVVFLSPVVINGLSVMAWLVILGAFRAPDLLAAHRWMLLAVWATALYLPLFVALQRTELFARWFHKKGTERFPWRTILGAIGASFAEWLFAGLTFWFISSFLLSGVTLREMLGLYTASAVAGIISMAPGGIGAFDLTMLLGLKAMGYEAGQVMAVLILFRLFYYVVPWVIGLILSVIELGLPGQRQRKTEEGEEPLLEIPLTFWQKLWRRPDQFGYLTDLSVWALGKLVLVSGLLLLGSAALPGILGRIGPAAGFLPVPLMHLSHQLSVIIGFTLILLSRDITLKVKQSFHWVFMLLLAGAVFTFAKAFDVEEAAALLVVALLLWISRGRFYRRSAPVLRWTALLRVIVTAAISLVYYWIGSHYLGGFLKHFHLQETRLDRMSSTAYALSAIIGFVGAWLLVFLLFIMRPERLKVTPAGPEEMEHLDSFLKQQQGSRLTHLLFAGDKSFYWAMHGQVLIAYAKARDKLVVLGDPLGEPAALPAAINEFEHYADLYGMSVVFYQVTPAYLPVYQDNGYRLLRLTEEARVYVDDFASTGDISGRLQHLLERFEGEGYSFELVSPPHSRELLERLKQVSDDWLKGRQEKGFSLGWFNEAYLQRAEIAWVKDPKGEVLAFASLAPGYDGGQSVSIDLLRYKASLSNRIMDYLLVRLLLWSQEAGYRVFNFGSSPLSGDEEKERMYLEKRLARLVFQHGGHWYGFSGLLHYKEKFRPDWEPRFLAYPSRVYLPVLMQDLVRLVSRRVP